MALQELLQDATAGDPTTGMKLTPSLAAKTLQGLASSGGEVVSHDPRSLVAASALLAANLSQAKSRHPQPGSRSAISLPASAAELVFGSKLAGN